MSLFLTKMHCVYPEMLNVFPPSQNKCRAAFDVEKVNDAEIVYMAMHICLLVVFWFLA